MDPGHLIETYRFWDVTAQWARELLVHEILVARALARGIVRDGLRMESTDPRWLPSHRPLRGDPYVGFTALAGTRPLILRADVHAHLQAIVHRAAEPTRELLQELFVSKREFGAWLRQTAQPLPGFWFTPAERAVS